MSETAQKSAIVVGAGIGGLAAACALAQSGWAVRVLEQSDWLGEMGAGLQLSPNAMAAAERIGIADGLMRHGFEPHFARIRQGQSGADSLRLPLRSHCRRLFGAPYLHIHRVDLHAVLLNRARSLGAELDLGQRVLGYHVSGETVTLTLENGQSHSAQLVVGADGVRSAITHQMNPEAGLQFTGQVAWRGLVPTEDLPPALISPDATVWTGQGGHVVTYYLRGGSLVNFVAVEERRDWQDPDWRQPGDPAELRARFDGWHPSLTTLFAATQETHLWALFGRATLPRWSDGPVVLLGDAAHPTLPFMAQGAAMALEDAVVLANCLQRPQTLPEALSRYETLRKPRTTMLQAKALANGRLFHSRDALTRAKHAVAAWLPPRLGYLPVRAVYGYDPRTQR